MRIFTVMLAVIVTSGCGIKFLYHQLDWYIPSVIEDFISLSDSQQSLLDLRVSKLIKWHRQTQLPTYAKTLRAIKQNIKDGLNEEHADKITIELEKYWKAVIEKMAPDMADLLIVTTLSQQQDLIRNFTENNKEYEEKYILVSTEKRLEKIVDDLIDNFERWTGPLTEPQVNILKDHVNNFVPVHIDRLEYRKQWQTMLVNAMRNNNKSQARQTIVSLFSEPKKHRAKLFTQKLDTNKEISKTLFLEINTILTAEQQRHLFAEIGYYAKSFDELAAEKN